MEASLLYRGGLGMVGTITEQITECLDTKKNFVLSGGAGSGKTYTLVQTLHYVFSKNPKVRVACITYTNVAANEIKERSPYSKLHVSTIHDFLWDEIKEYQKNLKDSVLLLSVQGIEVGKNSLSFSGENPLNNESFSSIQYQNYRDLEHGIISHDDVLKIANHMFSKYPLLVKILCDKYDYIFIDEYQDTHQSVVDIFLESIKKIAENSLCIGLFGDQMQSIYETGVGNIQSYIDSGVVKEIKKEDNYRCAMSVIELLNYIRSDISQTPARLTMDGTIANKLGSAKFLYSEDDFDLDKFRLSTYAAEWNFNDYEETKILLLTHKLSASRLGFAELLSAYPYNDGLIGNEPDCLAQHLLKIGGILFYYNQTNFAYVIENIQRRIKTNLDKQHISAELSQIYENLNISIEQIINKFDEQCFVRKDDRFSEYIEKYSKTYDDIKVLPASQIMAYFSYYNNFSPYSTQHGIKGAEFDNVLVVMDNGRWNNYNFKYYFEKTPGKESVLQRTERMFYVCCSRAKVNLVVYYPKPSEKIIEQAKLMFGETNVHILV